MIRKGRFDVMWLGVLLGLLAPVLIFLVAFLFKTDATNMTEFLDFLITFRIISKLLSLCVVPNLALFYIFLKLDYLYTTRGVLMATICWALLVAAVKFGLL